MTASTVRLVDSRTFAAPLITRETVFLETFARRAMSLIVDRLRPFSAVSVGVLQLQESAAALWVVHDGNPCEHHKAICPGTRIQFFVLRQT